MNDKCIQSNTGGAHILVVDDELLVGFLIREILTAYGYEVSLFNNSREALCAFEKTPYKFDLIITDLLMPEMTGTELMEKLIAIRSDIPVILSSGDCNQFDADNYLQKGAYGCVVKPIDRCYFLKLIRGAIECTSEFT